MNNLMMILAVAAIALISCGDDLKAPDASVRRDSSADAFCSECPPPPTLGAVVDRMGRPAVNTALNHAFDANATRASAAKDAYNNAPRSMWGTFVGELAKNLGIIDSLDTGIMCSDGVCTNKTTPTPGDGCGNQVEYNNSPGGGGSARSGSYATLAGILSDDELYLDTTKTTCELPSHANYLAYEFKIVTTIANTTCGGRAPTNDVIDTSYTALAIGITGFKVSDGSFKPAFGDGVPPHTDLSNDVFPFLGAPH